MQRQVTLINLIERMDKIDIILLKKFYFTSKDFPNDMQVYAFPILIKELREVHKVSLTDDAIRKRLKKLCELGLLEHVKNSNPSIFLPIEEKKNFVEELIKQFISYIGLEIFI
ncbi:MAG: hypothetical protein RMJ17_01445 [Candidatus Aenigmarchaeota archaeon]|nr:transaldolase family protein [Candidatus Aenigmarchaeota archaeon]MDW8149245.1 hypothetical protein [Candidatus Aenigmarchaeota archaeon]